MEFEKGISKWYAVSTHARHEKKAYSFLQSQYVTVFLPTYTKIHKWRNGVNAAVELPLFPGYLFVRVELSSRLRILQSPGVVDFVTFSGLPAEISEFEIERLRSGLSGLNPEPHPYLNVGDMVLVKSGPLAGIQGVVVNKKNETRIVITMDLLMRAISVEVDPANLEPIVRRPQAAVVVSKQSPSVTSQYDSVVV